MNVHLRAMANKLSCISLLQKIPASIEQLRQIPKDTILKELDDDGRTPLHHSISLGQPRLIVSYLCSIFPTSFVKDEADWTPLHIACTKRRIDYVELLLSSFPSGSKEIIEFINCPTNTGQTALHYCASKGFIEAIPLLLNVGANSTLCDNIGMIPVHRAVSAGQLESLKALICPSSIRATDKSGNTLLHIAVENQYIDIIKYLMNTFPDIIDPNAENNDKESPLSLSRPYPNIKSLLNL